MDEETAGVPVMGGRCRFKPCPTVQRHQTAPCQGLFTCPRHIKSKPVNEKTAVSKNSLFNRGDTTTHPPPCSQLAKLWPQGIGRRGRDSEEAQAAEEPAEGATATKGIRPRVPRANKAPLAPPSRQGCQTVIRQTVNDMSGCVSMCLLGQLTGSPIAM